MERNYIHVLTESGLFHNFTQGEINDLFSSIHYKVMHYFQNDMLATEGDPIRTIGIILSGNVHVTKIHSSGRMITIKNMPKSCIIGHVSVFADQKTYPSTMIAATDVTLLFITHNEIKHLCHTNTKFLDNFLKLLSEQTLYLSNKLKFFSYETIRKKLCSYILEQYNYQKKLRIHVAFNRNEMADFFGVTRPALSNALIKMKKDGLIDYGKHWIEIADVRMLEDSLQ